MKYITIGSSLDCSIPPVVQSAIPDALRDTIVHRLERVPVFSPELWNMYETRLRERIAEIVGDADV